MTRQILLKIKQMSTTVKYSGRLGNRLFLYTYGRILVENDRDFGPLIADPIPGFPGTHEKVKGTNKKSALRIGFGSDGWGKFFKSEGGLNYKTYCVHKKRVRQFLRFKRLPPQPEDKLVIHIRLGDYLNDTKAGAEPAYQRLYIPPVDVYYKIIDIDKPSSVCFVTDSPRHKYIRKLKSFTRYNCKVKSEVVSEDTLHDFAFLASANRLCIAHSTFSWWAGWLSDATKIYCPTFENKYYPGYEHYMNFWVDDEDRYIKVDV
jgi:hypothetical protein